MSTQFFQKASGVPRRHLYRILLGMSLGSLSTQSSSAADLAALKLQSQENTGLSDKDAKRIFRSGMDLIKKAEDDSDKQLLYKAEEKFSLLIDELAPNYAYSYTSRANARVALGNYRGAIEDYGRALELAPLAPDAWLTYLNLGLTLLAVDQPNLALPYMIRSVSLSPNSDVRADALLGRAKVYDALGRYADAIEDYGAVLEKNPMAVQPWWLRYSLDLCEVDQRRLAIGLLRRLRNLPKSEGDAGVLLGVCAILWHDGSKVEQEEALIIWNEVELQSKNAALSLDLMKEKWPQYAVLAVKDFRENVPTLVAAEMNSAT